MRVDHATSKRQAAWLQRNVWGLCRRVPRFPAASYSGATGAGAMAISGAGRLSEAGDPQSDDALSSCATSGRLPSGHEYASLPTQRPPANLREWEDGGKTAGELLV